MFKWLKKLFTHSNSRDLWDLPFPPHVQAINVDLSDNIHNHGHFFGMYKVSKNHIQLPFWWWQYKRMTHSDLALFISQQECICWAIHFTDSFQFRISDEPKSWVSICHFTSPNATEHQITHIKMPAYEFDYFLYSFDHDRWHRDTTRRTVNLTIKDENYLCWKKFGF